MMRIRGLHIQTSDLPATRAFYEESLGLPVSFTSQEKLIITLPESHIVFHAVQGLRPTYHIAFTIPCNQIEEALTWMRRRAELIPVTPEHPIADFRNWNAKALYFFDNNGNILELIGRSDLHNEDSRPFGASSILGISEFGVVGTSVPPDCEALIARFGIPYFSRQPALPHFAALGTDEGLMIVVPEGRPWYPTSLPAEKHYFRLSFETGGATQVLEGPFEK